MTQPDFIVIPTQLLVDTRLQALDRIVFGYIYWLHRLKDGACTASNETLADLCGAHKNAVGRCVEHLEAFGYVKRYYTDEKNRHRLKIESLISYGTHQPTGGSPHQPTGGQSNSSNKKSIEEEVVPTELEQAPLDRRNPDVQKIVDKFIHTIGYMPRPIKQRYAASTLIKRYGTGRVVAAINFLDTKRGDRFCPRISNLEELRDKWVELETYARKQVKTLEVI